MKKHLRLFLINLAALWLVTNFLAGVNISGGLQSLALTALTLTVVNLAIRPLIKLLFLPINLITLGAFRWLVNVGSLYLVTLFVPQFEIRGFRFPGYNYQGFTIPAMNLNAFWALVLVSLIISFTTTLLLWLIRK